MAFLLYAATALALLWATSRLLRPISLAAACILLVLPLGLTGKALLTDAVYGPIDHLYQHDPLASLAKDFGIGATHNASAVDIWSEFLPWREALRQSLSRGEWPLWDAYNLSGLPLAASAQAAPYSPFTLIACLLPSAVSLSYTAAMALFVAALSAFLFGRELGLSEGASLFAAAGWALAASIVLYSLTAMGFATALLPLVLAGTRRTVERPDFQSGALLTLALVLTILSGHPESLFLNVFVGCLYGLFELVSRRAPVRAAVVTASTAGMTALLLTAIFLLPVLEAIPQSIEYSQKSVRRVPEPSVERVLAGIVTNFFPHLHVRPWEVPRLSYIDVETAAAGSLILTFAIYACWRRRSAGTWFFAALVLLGMAAGASWPPVTRALNLVPLMQITLTARLAFAAALALVMLAAIGVEGMAQRREPRRVALVAFLLLILLAAGSFWLSRRVVLGDPGYGQGKVTLELLFLVLTAVALFLPLRQSRLIPIALVLLVGQRLLTERDTFRTFPAAAATPHLALLDPLRDIREPFRIAALDGAFPPSTNILYGLEDVRGYEALTFAAYWDTFLLWSGPHGVWFNHVEDLRRPFLSFLNVRFAIQGGGEPVPEGWQVIRRANDATLLENPRVLERVFIPQRVALHAMTPLQTVERMNDISDFQDVAWIETPGEPGVQANGPGRVTLRSWSRKGEYVVDAAMQAGGWVVLSDVAWKGWQATMDGQPVPLHRANAAFLGVFVPKGTHRLHLQYWPRSFVHGRAVTALTALTLIAWMTIRAYRSRSRV